MVNGFQPIFLGCNSRKKMENSFAILHFQLYNYQLIIAAPF